LLVEFRGHTAASDHEGCRSLAERRPRSSANEPYLSTLASLLLTGREGALQLALKKGGVVLLELVGEPGPGRAVRRWSVSPKILR
jgi:hypothetical protein